MKRYLVRVSLDQSPEITSALAAASISVGAPRDRGMTLVVNAHSADEALGELRQALRRWGEIEAVVIGEERL